MIPQAPVTVVPTNPCSTPCTPSKLSNPFSLTTSTSSSSMTWITRFSDSKKPLTATRSMRLVVALYSVRRTVFSLLASEEDSRCDVMVLEVEGKTREKSR